MDVSLELYRRGASKPYLVWIWECKDYRHRVPVDDVEEFHTKLEQIGLHKTKGTIVCRNGFQASTIRVAEAYGISLARILPDGSIIRLMEAAVEPAILRESVIFGLTEPDTEQLTTTVYGLSSSGKGVTNISDLIALEIKWEMEYIAWQEDKMRCTPDMVEFKSADGEIYVKKTDCLLTEHWRRKHNARAKTEWMPQVGRPWLEDPDIESMVSVVPGPEWNKVDTVWAVPSSDAAREEAVLIQRFVSATRMADYRSIRARLSQAGYPESALDAVSPPG